MEAIFFCSAAEFRSWLQENHADAGEVLVGFHRRSTGKPSMTWTESVDQALCFGWIDGVRRSAGPDAYTIRFTPRKSTSVWSNVNVAKVDRLTRQRLMQPAGLAAFQRRRPEKTGTYAFENAQQLGDEYEAELRASARAWAWFDRQPPSYRRTASHWVMSAKKEETRRSRLATLIADSAAGRKIKPLRRPGE